MEVAWWSSQCRAHWRCALQVPTVHIPSPHRHWLPFLCIKIRGLSLWLTLFLIFSVFPPSLSERRMVNGGSAGSGHSHRTRFPVKLGYFWWILHVDPKALTNWMEREDCVLVEGHRFAGREHCPGYPLGILEYLCFIFFFDSKKRWLFPSVFSQSLVKW